MANGLGSHEDSPRAVAVFSETSTREDVVRRTHTNICVVIQSQVELGIEPVFWGNL
jgi:hypothetical protein